MAFQFLRVVSCRGVDGSLARIDLRYNDQTLDVTHVRVDNPATSGLVMEATIDWPERGINQSFVFQPGDRLTRGVGQIALVVNEEGGLSMPFGLSVACRPG